jgi:hypothetical protein
MFFLFSKDHLALDLELELVCEDPSRKPTLGLSKNARCKYSRKNLQCNNIYHADYMLL